MAMFDEYVLKARVAPLYLVVLPLGVTAALLGWDGYNTLVLTAGGGAVAGVVALVGSDVVRSLGRDLQSEMWQDAGGAPSTRAFLAESDEGADRRGRLAQVTGLPVDRDKGSVERAEAALRQVASAEEFRPLRVANIEYGRARHYLALRTYGLGASLLGAGAAGTFASVALRSEAPGVSASDAGLALFFCLAVAGFWWRYPDRRRYERAAQDYADRLLASLDVLYRDGRP